MKSTTLSKNRYSKRRGSLWEPFHKRQYCTYKEFFRYDRKKKIKSLKYSSKEILLLLSLQAEGLPLYSEINSSPDISKYFTKVFCISYYSLTLIYKDWVYGVPNNIFSATNFNWKMPESSDFMNYSIFMLENIYHLVWVPWDP